MNAGIGATVNLTGRQVDGRTVTPRQNTAATRRFNALSKNGKDSFSALEGFSSRLAQEGILYKLTNERVDKIGLEIAAHQLLEQIKQDGQVVTSGETITGAFRNLWKAWGVKGADKIALMFGREDPREGRIAALQYLLTNSPSDWRTVSLASELRHSHDPLYSVKGVEPLTYEQRERVLGMTLESASAYQKAADTKDEKKQIEHIDVTAHFVQREIVDLYIGWGGKLHETGMTEALSKHETAINKLNEIGAQAKAGTKDGDEQSKYVEHKKGVIVRSYTEKANAAMVRADTVSETAKGSLDAGRKKAESGNGHVERGNHAQAEADYKIAREELPKAEKGLAEAIGLYESACRSYTEAATLATLAGHTEEAKVLEAKASDANGKKEACSAIEVPRVPSRSTVNLTLAGT